MHIIVSGYLINPTAIWVVWFIIYLILRTAVYTKKILIYIDGSAEKRNNGANCTFFFYVSTANHHLSVSSESESQLSLFISSNQVRERWCYIRAEQLGRLIWTSQRRWCILSLSISVYRVSWGSRSRKKDKANGEWIQGRVCSPVLFPDFLNIFSEAQLELNS